MATCLASPPTPYGEAPNAWVPVSVQLDILPARIWLDYNLFPPGWLDDHPPHPPHGEAQMLCWLAFGEHEALKRDMKRVGILILT